MMPWLGSQRGRPGACADRDGRPGYRPDESRRPEGDQRPQPVPGPGLALTARALAAEAPEGSIVVRYGDEFVLVVGAWPRVSRRWPPRPPAARAPAGAGGTGGRRPAPPSGPGRGSPALVLRRHHSAAPPRGCWVVTTPATSGRRRTLCRPSVTGGHAAL